ncbi:selenocysteine-specific translation elongation factor [candidate division KSB1 bacterium]|nr:selenocysteine-specific translation elongation factor [candidate division KSB1 bacterium]
MAHKIIGTAGHIDHGKSTLVKVLTGTDPDRLAEEQTRGMTIDLGFAFLGDSIAFIDVPGHEKFIKNMVAGVSTIDIAMLVIAADDGVMPQTREHLDILKILHLKRGLVALTKIDMVDEEWLAIVEEDVRELLRGSFLQDAPIMKVSAVSGEGVAQLRQALIRLAEQADARQDRGIFWMPIDRSFTMKGHGTVVTGSVLSGSIAVGDSCELLPQKRSVKIRAIQTHGVAARQASLGDRAALNLMNIAKDDIERGNILATAAFFEPTTLFDVKLSLLENAPKALSHGSRVRLHIGTREIMARLKLLGVDKLTPGQSAYAQMMLEEVAVAQKRDPFVIRQYSPQLTIGGGIILDPNPESHRRTSRAVLERLHTLESLDASEIVMSILLQTDHPIKPAELCKKTTLEPNALEPLLQDLLQKKQLFFFAKEGYLHKNSLAKRKTVIINELEKFHQKEPLRAGMKRANLLARTAREMPAVFDAIIADLLDQGVIVLVGDSVKLSSHEIRLSGEEEKIAASIYEILQNGQFVTPPAQVLAQQLHCPQEQVQRGLNALMGMGKIVRFEGDIYFTRSALESARQKLQSFAKSEITVAEFRQMLDTSRKFAVPLLGYFDDLGITARTGDTRIIKKR